MMTLEKLQAENVELKRRLEEAEETLRAIQTGAVDAFVVEEESGNRIYTLEGADRPYRLMVEQMQQGSATLYADGTVAYCNRQFAEMLQAPHEKMFGAALRTFVSGDDLNAYDGLLEQARTHSGRGELRMRRGDGTLIPAFLTCNVLPGDCGAAIGVLVTDLTMQKHHEQLTAVHSALRETEERYRSLVSIITDVLWTADSAGRFVAPQPAWETYTGQTWAEYGEYGWLRVLHPDDRDDFEAEWRQCCEAKTPFAAGGRLFHAETREYRHFVARAVPLTDAKGLVREWVGACTDDHDRTRAEQEVHDADRRKTEFLATLAHELRNPLAPLRNMLEIIKRSHGDGELLESARASMSRQLRHLVRLVDDLLDVSRISRGNIELKRERLSLAAVVRQTLETCQPVVEAGGHRLEVSLPDAPIALLADPVRLSQIIGNLLNNSCKYTKPGGQIWLTVQRVGDEVEMRIKDTGIGIPADKLDSIFELFTQVDQSLERSQGGLGIGLTLVKRLVEMHGGTVIADSGGLNQGSEFVVRLPVLAEAVETEASSNPAAEPASATRRILVVDDNRDAANSLAMLLKITGNETRTAHDGEEALRTAADFHPDMMLLDIGLPKMNGYDVCREIRKQAWGNSISIYALTGWGQDEDRQNAKDAGFDGHLVKPVDYDVLTAILSELEPAAP